MRSTAAVPGNSSRQPVRSVQQLAHEEVKRIIGSLPKRNNRSGHFKSALNPQEHPNFIYPLPNPTIHSSNAVGKLDPLQFQAMGAQLVVLAPDIYWDKLVTVRCPLCKEPANPHGWCPQLRRVCGLHHTYFVLGRRYSCRDCARECNCPLH